jgi:uncharacterized membrane protein
MVDTGHHDFSRSDTRRATTFADSVLAIIITVLVLDLRPPQGKPGGLASGLLALWPAYLAYATSYIYVAVVWLNHKAAFGRIRIMDRPLHWAHFGTLATTALLPFPTVVVADAIRAGNGQDERTAVALYALVGALLCASWTVFFHYLGRHRDLADPHVEDNYFVLERLRTSIGFGFYVLAGVLGFFLAPAIALVLFLVVPLFYGLTSHGLSEAPHALRRFGPRSRDAS